jgi:hypothetical protein
MANAISSAFHSESREEMLSSSKKEGLFIQLQNGHKRFLRNADRA